MSEGETGQEWPKPWAEIKTPDDTPFARVGDTHLEFMDGVRGYNGTLYVSVDIGHETDENRDLWMPFDCYLHTDGGDGDV